MEETISLKEIFEVLKKRMGLILSLIVGAAVISALVSCFVLTSTHEASSQFTVSQTIDQTAAIYDGNQIRSNAEYCDRRRPWSDDRCRTRLFA